MTITDWLAAAEAALAASNAWRQPGLTDESPRREAQWLLRSLLGLTSAQILSRSEQVLSGSQLTELNAGLKRRCDGEPLAYIVGQAEFWSLPLRVTPATLIPRADTETLVEVALALFPDRERELQVVDLGCGSGAIALALKHERPHWQVTAVDACADALGVAIDNAQQLKLPLRCLQSNWLSALANERFDLIVSNPPYLAADDMHLPTLSYEPRTALVADMNGLGDYRRIISQAQAHLNEQGWLLLEHGAEQADAVRSLCQQAGLSNVQSWSDLSGQWRVSGGQHGVI
ncbi:MAG: peptide chain release factor N(5)-glutamine methyltransferase [Moraxellaceae bacterium]|nr:peptide chain release factor N(5)-glutamine methyltransferase [Moraxellaceae bacterium]MDP1776933.1 peptide chain release factor N(5)-glutamine methyltransferase [Moraxellaceae bacterium]MDZ4298413.1 peptide chain release factor N(5)-glutamine methyltransferase [Moraxellaceae bacterium]MDZ4388008.1 peptide chain release factor N(5)-glutamine methyltransferase [Moraxellaceae bacterium]